MVNQRDTFTKHFCCDDDCYKYLASLKWQEDKFVCKKCGNTTYHKGRSLFSRRCNRCKYDESVTAGTMFEKLKFPILTAFNIIYRMVKEKEGVTSTECAKKFQIQQRTCWTFMNKVRLVMGHIYPKQLNGDVGVGVFDVIDENSVGWRRRWNMPKERFLLAVEVKDRRMKKAVTEVVENVDLEVIMSFIDRHVNPDAHIIFETRKRGFKRQLQDRYKSIEFPYGWKPLEFYFENLQDWLYRDIHSFTFKNLQQYTNEYNFRRNNPKNSRKAFNAIICEMVKNN